MRPFFPLCFFIAFSVLAACATQAPVQNQVAVLPATPITLNIGKITFVEEYTAPMREPHVEHLFSPMPSQGIRQWVASRLIAGGGENTMEVIIKEASVVRSDLPRTKGLKGIFTNDQAERYDGKLAVELRIYKPGELMSKANASAEVMQSRTVAENASVASRDAIFRALNADLMTLLDRELERNIRQYFAPYIR